MSTDDKLASGGNSQYIGVCGLDSRYMGQTEFTAHSLQFDLFLLAHKSNVCPHKTFDLSLTDPAYSHVESV